MSLSFLQSAKVPLPMYVTLSGISIFSRLLHPLNASSPIVVNADDNFTSVIFSQNAKAPASILVTVSGISIFSISGQFFNKQSGIRVIPSSNRTVFRPIHPVNIPSFLSVV